MAHFFGIYVYYLNLEEQIVPFGENSAANDLIRTMLIFDF